MAKDPLKHKEQRVGVFVDVSNLYFSAQNQYNTNVDFKQLLKQAVSGRKLVRSFAYVIASEEGKEKDFFDVLEKFGYETRIKQLQVFQGGAKKGDWDVGLSIDVVRLLPLLDVVVLVSGDGDYVDLLDYVRAHGRRTEVIAFEKNTSSRLLEEADDFFDLGQDTKKFLI